MTDPQATPCAFCEIIAGHAAAHVIWTDENAAAQALQPVIKNHE